jgi:hypothetical protein
MKKLLILVLVLGCKQASEGNDTRNMPKLPPPPNVAPPAALKIAVEIDGKDAPAIDAAKLASVKPDFEDAERKAWRFSSLLGPAAEREGVSIAVSGDKDVTVVLKPSKSPKDPVPVLAVTRRGGIVAAVIEKDDPFPNYHGQGRRMARPGDPLPRVAGITRIKCYVEK